MVIGGWFVLVGCASRAAPSTAAGGDPHGANLMAPTADPLAADQCPDFAEDFDGVEDDDGCPEPDADHDGVLDDDDQCPAKKEDRDNDVDADGCPDP